MVALQDDLRYSSLMTTVARRSFLETFEDCKHLWAVYASRSTLTRWHLVHFLGRPDAFASFDSDFDSSSKDFFQGTLEPHRSSMTPKDRALCALVFSEIDSISTVELRALLLAYGNLENLTTGEVRSHESFEKCFHELHRYRISAFVVHVEENLAFAQSLVDSESLAPVIWQLWIDRASVGLDELWAEAVLGEETVSPSSMSEVDSR